MGDINFFGLIRRVARGGNSGRVQARLTQYESLAVAQYEPPYLESLRAGLRFGGGTQVIANGIAPVQAIPTTTATAALYNTSETYSLIVDQVGFFLGSGTAGAGATLLYGLSNGRVVAASIPAAAANYSSQCLSTTGKTSVARWGTAVTIPAGTAWVQATSTFQLAAANAGQGDKPAQPTSGILVPPGYALGFAILSAAGTTPLYSLSASWLEAELDIE